ncbi:MAG: hypothetical protein HC932_00305 [Thermales bacterium]|nr:hypothetical protein [Thermales bacterium]
MRSEIVIGFAEEFFGDGLDDRVSEVFGELKKKLSQTHQVKLVSLPMSKYNLSVYYILQTVEAAANLERFDSVRYGQQDEGSEMFFGGRSSYMGDETKRRIMLGTYTSSSGYYDAYYNKACQVRELISKDFEKAFRDIDVLIMPASPYPAFEIGENSADPMSMYLADIMTVSQPISKLPALVVPGSMVKSDDAQLPVGIQLVGAQGNEETLYKLGKGIVCLS